MKQFFRILSIIITLVILFGTTYYLVQYNKEYIENNPSVSNEDENNNDTNKTVEKSEVKVESKENIEKYAQKEKENIVNEIKSTINMNLIANARNTINRKILKSHYGEIIHNNTIASGEDSGEKEEIIQLPDFD